MCRRQMMEIPGARKLPRSLGKTKTWRPAVEACLLQLGLKLKNPTCVGFQPTLIGVLTSLIGETGGLWAPWCPSQGCSTGHVTDPKQIRPIPCRPYLGWLGPSGGKRQFGPPAQLSHNQHWVFKSSTTDPVKSTLLGEPSRHIHTS